MSQPDELTTEFLVESRENLDRLDGDLVALEKDPADRERIASIFRTIHTIKGTCGFLGFEKLERVTHVGENLLARMRDGELAMEEVIANALLEMVDAVRAMLAAIEEDGAEGDEEYRELIEKLTAIQLEGGRLAAPAGPGATVHEEEAPEPRPAPPAPAPVVRQATPPPPAPPEETPDGETRTPRGTIDTTIRVDVQLLDRLMNMVGELVLTRNQVLQSAAGQEGAIGQAVQRLDLVTSELQEGVMKTRMQPIGNVWNKMPRIVRDLATACGKRVRVVMEGKDTELDKTLLEAIKDPLTHLVRNSVDHGLETPERRIEAGKPEEGTLLLRAFHEGGQVNIEITDDGHGIDTERVKARAVERGLIQAERADRMSEKELVGLIFRPGFSTAEKVTNISGRGVGMDVVKTNIENIGGSIDVQTRLGHGTTIRIKIPLTLAIIPALMVTCDQDRFAIPQVNLLELVRLEAEQVDEAIEDVRGVPVYRLRDKLLPLVRLRDVLELGPAPRVEGQATSICVLQADGHRFGLIVDDVNDTEEIVVKPLGTQLKGLGVFAGATIRGDGRVALILDVMGVAQRSEVLCEGEADQVETVGRGAGAGPAAGISTTLLLIELGEDRRVAIPLEEVARLEEVPVARVEREGHHEVVQYRGQIMPLLDLGGLVGHACAPPGGELLPVVVYACAGASVGLVVTRILDIVDGAYVLDTKLRRSGVRGSAVIAERVTEILEIGELVERAGLDLNPALAGTR